MDIAMAGVVYMSYTGALGVITEIRNDEVTLTTGSTTLTYSKTNFPDYWRKIEIPRSNGYFVRKNYYSRLPGLPGLWYCTDILGGALAVLRLAHSGLGNPHVKALLYNGSSPSSVQVQELAATLGPWVAQEDLKVLKSLENKWVPPIPLPWDVADSTSAQKEEPPKKPKPRCNQRWKMPNGLEILVLSERDGVFTARQEDAIRLFLREEEFGPMTFVSGPQGEETEEEKIHRYLQQESACPPEGWSKDRFMGELVNGLARGSSSDPELTLKSGHTLTHNAVTLVADYIRISRPAP